MAILLRIAKNAMPVSSGMYLVMMLLITVSFNTMKAYMPLSQVANEDPITDHAHKIVTMLPVIFSSYELGTILFSSILFDLILPREATLMCSLVVWIIVPSLLYSAHLQSFFLFLIRLTAILRGFLETTIFSMGAQPYQSDDTDLLYVYVICNYCMYQVGSGMAQILFPSDIVESSVCGDSNCIKRAVLYSSACAAAASALYLCFLSSPRDDKAPENATGTQLLKSESYKLLCIIGVLIPCAVFWVYYQEVIPQLSVLPNLINLFGISSLIVPVLYKILTLIIACLYYLLIYQWHSGFILKNPRLLMTSGGILLGLSSIYGAALFDDTDAGQYSQTKPDAIQITYVCQFEKTNDEFMDIPYYTQSDCNKKLGKVIVHRDQELVTRKNNNCPEMWVAYEYKFKYCLQAGHKYLWYICDSEFTYFTEDPVDRDPYGRPVICVMFQRHDDCRLYDSLNTYMMLYRHPNETHEALQYVFGCFKKRYDNVKFFSNYRVYQCHTIVSGSYFLTRRIAEQGDVESFYNGGVYFILLNYDDDYQVFTLVNPFQHTILNCRLVPLYVIRAIGEFLLVTNGFFFVCTQINQKFRTIAIGIWFMFIKFGPLMYEIQRSHNIYFRNGDLSHLGNVLIITAIVFYIMQFFLNCIGAREN